MRLPKLRELKEAVTAVMSPRFTTRFPATPCTVPERYRGKPEFDPDSCVGCGACVNVCPTKALTQKERRAHPRTLSAAMKTNRASPTLNNVPVTGNSRVTGRMAMGASAK